MSIARLKRLAALEAIAAKRRPTHLYFDPFDACMRLWAALEAEHAATKAREFSRVPRSDEPMSEEAQAAFELLMREFVSMATRLMAEAPEAALH